MEYLEKLVSIKSDRDCDEILKFIYDELKDKVKEIKIIENNNTKFLIAGINTILKDINPIVLNGHIDTVSANEKLYMTNPYELTKKQNKYFGLGSIDMKSFTAIVIDNINELKLVKQPIVLLLTTDEETNLNSIKLAIKKLKEYNIKPKFTIIGEPTNSQFNLTSNGCFEYNVEFFGKAYHSSNLNMGINAICSCAKLIDFIEQNQKKYNLTSNCGVINGGEVVNKVPDYAKLSFDIRSTSISEINKFVKDIKKELLNIEKIYSGLKCKLTKNLSIPALYNKQTVIIQKIADELNIKTGNFLGGCEAGYFTEYSGDAVIFGVGDLSLAHKPNEYVDIDEYNNYSTLLLKVLNKVNEYY